VGTVQRRARDEALDGQPGAGAIPGAAANAAARVVTRTPAPGVTGFPFLGRDLRAHGLTGRAAGPSIRARPPRLSRRAPTSQVPAFTSSARVVMVTGPLPGTALPLAAQSGRCPGCGTEVRRAPAVRPLATREGASKSGIYPIGVYGSMRAGMSAMEVAIRAVGLSKRFGTRPRAGEGRRSPVPPAEVPTPRGYPLGMLATVTGGS
jgi:hypothetical protein